MSSRSVICRKPEVCGVKTHLAGSNAAVLCVTPDSPKPSVAATVGTNEMRRPPARPAVTKLEPDLEPEEDFSGSPIVWADDDDDDWDADDWSTSRSRKVGAVLARPNARHLH